MTSYYLLITNKPWQERCWLMQLLHDGLRETGDYRIFEKRHVFKLLMSHISSSLGDIQSNVSIHMLLDALFLSDSCIYWFH